MNNKKMVKISNIIVLICMFLFIYWLFVLIAGEIFDLNVFGITFIDEVSILALFGILGLMFGALVMNIVFNLTRIAENHSDNERDSNFNYKILLIIFFSSFPLMFGGLILENFLTNVKKEKVLVSSAKSIVNESYQIEKLLNYKFDESWIEETAEIISIYSKIYKDFRRVSVIILDEINGDKVFLEFTDRTRFNTRDEDWRLNKYTYIREVTEDERIYLNEVFLQNEENIKFTSNNMGYGLFQPYRKDEKTIVFYFVSQ